VGSERAADGHGQFYLSGSDGSQWKGVLEMCGRVKKYVEGVEEEMPEHAGEVRECVSGFELELIATIQEHLTTLPHKIRSIL
jgi:hypothetical protein